MDEETLKWIIRETGKQLQHEARIMRAASYTENMTRVDEGIDAIADLGRVLERIGSK